MFFKNTVPCSIRMYDNQENIISQFNSELPLCNTIQVNNTPNIDIMKGCEQSDLYVENFLKINLDNKFAKYLYSISHKELGTSVGFDLKDCDQLKEWINLSEEKKIVIFDWDGTLSVIEGLILPSIKMYEDMFCKLEINFSEIAEYYAGTKNRLNMLKNMFLYLHSKNIEIFVLTNNPVAAIDWVKVNEPFVGNKSRANFCKLVKEFIPLIKDKNILCGYETQNFKPTTFLKNPYLRFYYKSLENEFFL